MRIVRFCPLRVGAASRRQEARPEGRFSAQQPPSSRANEPRRTHENKKPPFSLIFT